MNSRQMRTIESLRRVRDFLTERAPAPAPGHYTARITAIEGVIAELEGYAAGQDTGHRMSRAGTRRAAALRRRLRDDHMQPLAIIGRMLLEDVPGAKEALAMPPGNAHSENLVAAAYGMAAAAEAHADVFVANGQPADFVERLLEAARAVQAAVDRRATHVRVRSGATAGLGKTVARGRREVGLADAMVRTLFRGQHAILAEWRSAMRVPKDRRRSVEPVGTTPAAEPVPEPEVEPAAEVEPEVPAA